MEKRRLNLEYLRRAHNCASSSSESPHPPRQGQFQSPIYWLKTVALDPQRLHAYVDNEVKGQCSAGQGRAVHCDGDTLVMDGIDSTCRFNDLQLHFTSHWGGNGGASRCRGRAGSSSSAWA